MRGKSSKCHAFVHCSWHWWQTKVESGKGNYRSAKKLCGSFLLSPLPYNIYCANVRMPHWVKKFPKNAILGNFDTKCLFISSFSNAKNLHFFGMEYSLIIICIAIVLFFSSHCEYGRSIIHENPWLLYWNKTLGMSRSLYVCVTRNSNFLCLNSLSANLRSPSRYNFFIKELP